MTEFRSKFEKSFADKLTKAGLEYVYEGTSLDYLKPINKGWCKACESKKVFQRSVYIPDFFFPEYNFYIECKGKWTGDDRKKHLAVRETNPDVDIRFVFMSDNKLHKNSSTRYSDWCIQHGFSFTIGGRSAEIPKGWFV